MPFDLAPSPARRQRGRRNYDAGRMAEDSVALHYEAQGVRIAERRWRGEGGEIDIVAEAPDTVVFVEVKQSRTFDSAAEAITPQQVSRIMAAASEYVGRYPTALSTPMRFDLALVNARGELRILEGALCA
ncbi:YraN family protein [Vannielia litorea]|uniref:YraN family protein n=1 Tax=Vannielia litorea TaxID=1217970 RepID=UPI001C958635|nr:YraN family protein [Vannielia litorea]MBY6049099.1 YraN family protein [Vannielia litorea]MBY6076513.1 YraN family protein [Vannielia litorea]MBY6154750.1 YraN family protein [Vannielia litorea]